MTTANGPDTLSREVAGRIWRLDSPRAIANEICGEPTPLRGEELVFLCEHTGTSFAEVASFLPTSRSNVTYWSQGGRSVPRLESYRLKKWFWRKLFPAKASELMRALPVDALFEDTVLLARMRDLATTTGGLDA